VPSKSSFILAERVRRGQIEGRVPLFIIGSGISAKRIPLLADIGRWFVDKLEHTKLPAHLSWMAEYAERLAMDRASRREAAEFFSLLQSDFRPISEIWSAFSHSFLTTGFPVEGWKKRFPGISSTSVKPSPAHNVLARAIKTWKAQVISLNFDGLTQRALLNLCQNGVVLHSVDEIIKYYSADTDRFVPSVIKIRGDVFYALCSGKYCPLNLRPYPLDRLQPGQTHCPSCGGSELRLQFSFPGYRSKEEVAGPMLWTARQFLGHRTSCVIFIGVSGRWDQYLLQFVFQLAKDRQLLVADVKPPDRSDTVIDQFRSVYFPSVPLVSETTNGVGLVRVRETANSFLRDFKDVLQ
jgi:NAD-dependent SIR2 family protein deacetylase